MVLSVYRFSRLIAPPPRACVALLLLLSGCSLDVNGAVGEVGSALAPHCGWHKYPAPPPSGSCLVLTPPSSECGLLPPGVDACDMDPSAPLLVEAGEPHSEWHRTVGSSCEFIEAACPR